MRSRIGVITATLAIVAIFLVGFLFGSHRGRKLTAGEIEYVVSHMSAKGCDKIDRVVSLIATNYVDSIATDSIVEVALPLLLKELDPHSIYIPAREFERTEEPLQGEFDGIGVTFNMATDTVIVLSVIPSGPSQKAGVIGGDRIMKANDTVLSGVKRSTNNVMKHLRGPRGTKVKLEIERRGIADPVIIEVTRDAIPLHSVEAAVMLNDRTGLIKLSQFSRTSHKEVKEAIARLRKEGMCSLIFDLRGNSGGFLDQAILIANEFLPKNKLIVYTEDRARRQARQYSDGRGRATDIPLAILIDEASASSSEILAGAIQDNDRGTIVGRRSFGKGLVQQQVAFDDGSALRLTIARYFTPTGRSIQKPYEAGHADDYEMDMIRRYDRNEFFSADSIHFADSLRFTTPKGKTVYGGGGIMPDVFMPLDTMAFSRYYAEVAGRNILYRYTIEYADRHRERLSQAKTIADLRQLLDSDSGLFDGFVAYAERNGVKPVWRDIRTSRKVMEAQLRAYIARNSEVDNAAFYYFIQPIDNTICRAIELLDSELNTVQR